MYIKVLALFLSIDSALFAMEKVQGPIVEAESSIELKLKETHHILPLKGVLNHIFGCQQTPKTKEKFTISGFHVYPRLAEISTDGKEVSSTFNPLHKVLALGTITKFHKGYVIYRGVACPKDFFPVGWQRKDIIEYIHRLMAEGTVKIQEEAKESSSTYKTYQIVLSPSQTHPEDVPLCMILKGCPEAEGRMDIITLFPLIEGDLSSLKVNARTCEKEQRKYMLEQKLASRPTQAKKQIKHSQLLHAIEQKDYSSVSRILSSGADIEGATQEGVTPLMKAARAGEWELVSLLLIHDASKVAQDHKGNTALHHAVLSGDFHSVLSLLDKESINKPNSEGVNSLMLAVEHKYVDIAELLLSFDADINCKDAYNRTPLSLAVTALQRKKEDLLLSKALIELLLIRGAAIDMCNAHGMTALMQAVEIGQLPFVELLLQFQPDVEISNSRGETALSIAKKRSFNVIADCIKKHIQQKKEWLEEHKATELMYAVHSGKVSKVKEVLTCGADINAQSAYGYRALLFAVDCNNTELVQLLLERGADPCLATPYECSIYQYAQESSQVSKEIKLLLERAIEKYTAVVKEKERNEKAELQAKLKVLQSDFACNCLTQAGIEALSVFKERKISKDGCTPFLYAIRERKYTFVEQLIKEQLVSYALDNYDRGALAIACDNEDLTMIELLLTHGIPKESDIEQCLLKAVNTKRFIVVHTLVRMVPYAVIRMVYKALYEHNKELVQFFLKESALELNEKQAGELLFAAVQKSTTALISLILEQYPATAQYANEQGETALMMAAKAERTDIVALLCNAGASLEIKTVKGLNVFDYAQSRGNVFAFLQELEQKRRSEAAGAQEYERKQKEIQALRQQGYSSLMIAAHYSDCKVLENDVVDDINYANAQGTTALIVAAQKGNLDSLRAIAKKQLCNKNQKDKQGLTALMHAVLHKHYALVEELLRQGASALIVNNEQKNAFEMLNLKLSCQQIRKLLKGACEVAWNVADPKMTSTTIKELLLAAELKEVQEIVDLLSRGSSLEKEKCFNEINARTPFNSFRQEHKIGILTHLLNNGYLDSAEMFLQKTDYSLLLQNWDIIMQDESELGGAMLVVRYGAPVTWSMILSFIEKKCSEDKVKFFIEHCNEPVSDNIQTASNVLVELCRRVKTDLSELLVPRHLPTGKVKELVALLLKKGVPINCHDENEGTTPLIGACISGQDELINFLLESGADVNMPDFLGNTPLIAESQAGYAPMVKRFLDKGAQVNHVNNEGNTALYIACFIERVEIVKLLLQAGADVNLKNNGGGNAFRIAIDRKTNEIVRLLFPYYHSVDKNDRMWRNIFWNASCRGNKEVVEFLLSHGLNMESCDETKATHILFAPVLENQPAMVQFFLDRGAPVNVTLNDGRTPLIVACDKNHEKIAEMLLNAGASINAVTKENYTALMKASTRGHEAMVRFLIQRGADVNLVDKDYNPFLAAVVEGHVKLVQFLLPYIINEDYKKMAFIVACHLGKFPIIKLLLEAGISANTCDKQGNPLLFKVCSCKEHKNNVELFIKHKVDLNKEALDKNTPLMLAVAHGCTEIAQLLLQSGAEVNKQGAKGITALMSAASLGFIDSVHLLLSHQANPNIQDDGGNTALMYACESSRKEIIEALRQAGADCTIQNKKGESALTKSQALTGKEIEKSLFRYLQHKKK